MTEIIGKVGSKGELYPPMKIRNKIGLKPEMEVEFVISPNGELIIRKVEKLEDILNLKPIARVSQKEFEEMSEGMQYLKISAEPSSNILITSIFSIKRINPDI